MDTDVLEQRTAIDYHDCSHWWLVDIPLIRCMISLLTNTTMLVRFLHTLTGKKKPWYGWKQRPHQRTLDLMVLVLGDRDFLTKPLLDLYNNLMSSPSLKGFVFDFDFDP